MKPLKVALLGAGRRAQSVYRDLLTKLTSEIKVVAVCDPILESAEKLADVFDAKAFGSVRELVHQRPMEAAIIVTPVDSHHALSVYLSRNQIHHVCETSMASTLTQARSMRDEAQQAGVVLHVNEQFFRRELLCFMRALVDEGVIGDVHRMSCFHTHLGYHNNSIFQVMAGAKPKSVTSVSHTMPVHPHIDGADRHHEDEVFRVRTIAFENGFFVSDQAGNIKSALGRCPRPGYTELNGTKGTMVEIPSVRPAPWQSQAYVRMVDPDDFERGAYAKHYPIERVLPGSTETGCAREYFTETLTWSGAYSKLQVRLPDGLREYVNPMMEYGVLDCYLSSVGQALMEFARVVRDGGSLDFTVEQAVLSNEMEEAFDRSIERDGAKVKWPLEGQSDVELAHLEALKNKFGVDPMDVEAMLDISFPKNYGGKKSIS